MIKDDLTQKIIGCSYKVHNALGSGFLEKVYENALRIEIEKPAFQSNSRNQSKSAMKDMSSASTGPIFGWMSD